MKRLLQEPLLHFLLLGALLFLAYGLLADPGRAPVAIVVTQGRIEHLAASFARTWQRPPSEAELKGLVDEWVRDEMATREAIALGLDQDDPVIRRRLRQKLEFLSADLAAQSEPSDADLESYLQAHPDAFRLAPRLSFQQIFLDPQLRGVNLEHDAAKLLLLLNEDSGRADAAALGDPSLLDFSLVAVAENEIAHLFGQDFTAELQGLSLGRWFGPIASSFGLHLVRVSERTDARLPALAEARDAVRREWENAQRLEGNAKFYQAMLKRYTVIIEGFEPEKPQPEPSSAP